MNIYHLIADAATQPVFPPGTPTWAIGVVAVIGALGGIIAGLVLLMPYVSKLIEQVKGIATVAAVKAEAAQGTANQAVNHAQSIDRQMTNLAFNTPAPSQRPDNPPGQQDISVLRSQP